MHTRSPRRLIRLRINPQLHQLIRLHAALGGVSQAEVIRRSIRRDLATPRRSAEEEARAECAQKGETPWPEYPSRKSIG